MPNIQNAWSYVCQNECQRAINDAIASYDSQMRKILEKAKEQCNEDLIRKEKSLLKEQAVSAFKSKAVGQEIQEYELQLREGISKKNKDIKQDFIRYCKSKAQHFLEADIDSIKKNLQNDIYENMDKFMEDLERMKSKYYEQGPNFSGRGELFAETAQTLVCKAADFMNITSRKEADGTLKKLRERAEELEKEKSEQKIEFLNEKRSLQEKLYELEIEKNQAIRNERLLEERLKYLQEDKDKQEKLITERFKLQLSEIDIELKSMESKNKRLENQLKQKDDDHFKKVNEFEKLNALIEQKLQLTEKELVEQRAKYQAKDTEYRDLNKELFNTKKEVQQATNQLNRLEEEKNDEIRHLKQSYEQQILQLNQVTSGNPQVGSDD